MARAERPSRPHEQGRRDGVVTRLVLAAACGAFAVLAPALTSDVSAQAAGLPPRDAFLRDVRERLTRSQEAAHRYEYKERRTELHLNPFGRMGTGGTNVFHVTPSPNAKLTYRRLIERNGVPVPQVELDRQDAEYAARVKRMTSNNDQDSAEARERRRNEDLLASRRAQMIVDDVIGVLQFDLTKREFRGGKAQIVIAFAAKPGARPLTREGQLMKAFRGNIWVDEASREIVDAQATAIDNVGFGGGLVAKIYEGMESSVERREIDPGVWMPTRLTLRGEVRAIFRRTRIDHVVEWFDYRAIQ